MLGLFELASKLPEPGQRFVALVTDPMVTLMVMVVVRLLTRVFVDSKVRGGCRPREAPQCRREEVGVLARVPPHPRPPGGVCWFVQSGSGKHEYEATKLDEEAAALRSKAGTFPQSEFAKAAKMERQAVVLEMEAERLRGAVQPGKAGGLVSGLVGRLSRLATMTLWASYLISGGLRKPVLFVPQELVAPAGFVLRSFRGGTAAGTVVAVAWVKLCDRAAATLWARLI